MAVKAHRVLDGKTGRTSQEKFVNARAEWWWMLRERFRKTWEVVNEGADYTSDELISIPNHATLIQQLSLPLAEPNEAGKIRIESKANMRRRGVASPDFADMLAYLFVMPVMDSTISEEAANMLAGSD